MITSLEQAIKNKKSKPLEPELKRYLVDKNPITSYQKRIWFKGSRYR